MALLDSFNALSSNVLKLHMTEGFDHLVAHFSHTPFHVAHDLLVQSFNLLVHLCHRGEFLSEPVEFRVFGYDFVLIQNMAHLVFDFGDRMVDPIVDSFGRILGLGG